MINIETKKHLTLYRVGLFLVFLHLWMSAQAGIAELYLPVKNAMLVLILIVFFFQTQYLKLSIKTFLALGLGAIIALYNYTKVNDAWILYSYLLVIYSRNLNLKDVIRTYYVYLSFLFAINMLLFIPQYISGSALYIETTETRRYLMNFQSPNEAAMTWVTIIFAYFYTRNFNLLKIIAIVLISFFMYRLTSSDAIWFLAIIPIGFICSKRKKLLQLMNTTAPFAFVFFCIGTFFLIYQKPIWVDYLDKVFFTGRLNLSKLAIEQYGYTWFGQKVDLFTGIGSGNDYQFLVVDNAFAYIAIRTGLFFLVSLCFLFISNPVKDNYKAALSYFFYALFALAENNILNPLFIFPLIIAYNIKYYNEHTVLHS